GIGVGQVGERVDAHGRDLELPLQGAAVEGLDVLELVDEGEPARVEPLLRQGVEHDGVVRVGAVPDPDGPSRIAGGAIALAHGLPCFPWPGGLSAPPPPVVAAPIEKTPISMASNGSRLMSRSDPTTSSRKGMLSGSGTPSCRRAFR